MTSDQVTSQINDDKELNKIVFVDHLTYQSRGINFCKPFTFATEAPVAAAHAVAMGKCLGRTNNQ